MTAWATSTVLTFMSVPPLGGDDAELPVEDQVVARGVGTCRRGRVGDEVGAQGLAALGATAFAALWVGP